MLEAAKALQVVGEVAGVGVGVVLEEEEEVVGLAVLDHNPKVCD